MPSPSHAIARAFFDALNAGSVPDDLLVEDLNVWTTTSGANSGRARYQGGVRLFASLFPTGLRYHIESLTSEADRVAVEARSEGVLANGDAFFNRYVFLLRIRDDRIASIAEHFHPDPVRTQIAPLIAAAMAKAPPS